MHKRIQNFILYILSIFVFFLFAVWELFLWKVHKWNSALAVLVAIGIAYNKAGLLSLTFIGYMFAWYAAIIICSAACWTVYCSPEIDENTTL